MRKLIASKQKELSDLRVLEVKLSKELDDLWEEYINSVKDVSGVSTSPYSSTGAAGDAERQLHLNLM